MKVVVSMSSRKRDAQLNIHKPEAARAMFERVSSRRHNKSKSNRGDGVMRSDMTIIVSLIIRKPQGVRYPLFDEKMGRKDPNNG